MKKSGRRYLIPCALVLLGTLSLSVLIILFFQSYKYWADLKGNSAGWIGRVHRADNELGYVPIPQSAGAMVLSDGTSIPVFYDSRSFRSGSRDVLEPGPGPVPQPNYLLGLGCSFMFGFGVPVRSTFCHLTADKLGMIPLNAGRCSYGLAEMLILARQLIPQFKPEIVLVQYSPWLADRSQQRYGSTFFGLLPHPYFVEETGRGLRIHGPDFKTIIFNHDFGSFRLSDRNTCDLMNFTLSFGFPLLFHDLWHSSLIRLKESLGVVPQPSQDSLKIVSEVYRGIGSICKQFGCRMFIVVLGIDNRVPDIPESFGKLNVRIVNAQIELIDILRTDSNEEYARGYYHWGGKPPRVIDKHPNVRAHAIIAESVVINIEITHQNNTNN